MTNTEIELWYHKFLGKCPHKEVIQQEVAINTTLYRLQCTDAKCRKRFTDRHHLLDEQVVPNYLTKGEMLWNLTIELWKAGNVCIYHVADGGFNKWHDVNGYTLSMDANPNRAVMLAWISKVENDCKRNN